MVPELEFHDCSMQMYSSEDLALVEKISIKKKLVQTSIVLLLDVLQ